ncbi:transcription factor MafK [Eurytemora carolleeae]|uniref:transcription factor MafK n=1 Tax=Eurytemora carolleeae TaxID=1294199 RepID=UPI000C772224|nr:transcription factor MafK [Eurytemora carolleeae]|eukprot:XP_023340129.1 transcription factor MafK-like [Eurytemora affinis]
MDFPDDEPCASQKAPYAHRNMTDFAPDNFGLFSDEELITITTKNLNERLKKNNVPKKTANALKEKRRTLKNRGYAASCRVKKELKEEEVTALIAREEASFLEQKNRNMLKASAIKNKIEATKTMMNDLKIDNSEYLAELERKISELELDKEDFLSS